jgi:transposase InsO family protein
MRNPFKYIKGDLCVGFQSLLSVCERNESTIKTGLIRNRKGMTTLWRHYPDPQDKRVKWIAVDSLTEIYTARLQWAYGNDLHLVAKRETLRSAVRERMEERDFLYFIELKNESNMTLYSMEDAEQLQEAAAWLRLAHDTGAMQRLGWSKKTQWYDDMATVLGELNLKGLTVGNGQVLKRRVDQFFAEGGIRTLIHGNINNEAARKVTDTGVERIMMLYSSPTKPPVEIVAELYNAEQMKHGGGSLTVERIRQIIAENKHAWFALRHGNQEADKALSPHLKRKRASRPDALWYLDGTALQLLYMDDQGKVKSDLYVQYVTDAHTDAVIGYAIGHTETSELVMSSIRKAVRCANTLPEQVSYDNGSANTSGMVQKALDRLTRLHHATAPYNAKAKRVESVSGRIEAQVMRVFGNYKGGNITARSLNTRANAEHIKALVADGGLPNLRGVIEQVRLVMEMWNSEQSRMDTYQNAALDVRKVAQENLIISALWVERPDTCTYMAHGLKTMINNVRYEYAVHSEPGVEDLEWRKYYLGDSFKLMHDPDDSEHRKMALIDPATGALVAVAERKYEYAEALIDRPDGEGEMLYKALQSRKAALKNDRQVQEQKNATLKQLDFGVFDHRLAHKDAFNRMESEAQNAELGLLDNTPQQPKRYSLFDGTDASLEELD